MLSSSPLIDLLFSFIIIIIFFFYNRFRLFTDFTFILLSLSQNLLEGKKGTLFMHNRRAYSSKRFYFKREKVNTTRL